MRTAWSGRAWSCTVRLVVDDARALAPAVDELTDLLARVDRAASRFRVDSDLTRANGRAGRPTPVSPLLVDLVRAALDAARTTGGAVDPTLGHSLVALGYDRDIDLARDGAGPPARPVPGGLWHRVRADADVALLTVPVGCALDLGATAKAWTADLAARTLAARFQTAVLVELGGDVAVAGSSDGGWAVRVAERAGVDGQVVTLTHGGLATSTTVVRAWRHGGVARHHLLDPRTGEPVDGPWRTTSVHAASAYDANVASTAALVLGDAAPTWLGARGIAARLVGRDGDVVTTAGWPGHVTDQVVPVPGPHDLLRMSRRRGNVITVHHRSAS